MVARPVVMLLFVLLLIVVHTALLTKLVAEVMGKPLGH